MIELQPIRSKMCSHFVLNGLCLLEKDFLFARHLVNNLTEFHLAHNLCKLI